MQGFFTFKNFSIKKTDVTINNCLFFADMSAKSRCFYLFPKGVSIYLCKFLDIMRQQLKI